MQILTARGDGLWRAATDLQEELVDGQRERKAMQRRTNRIIQKVKSRTEPRSVKVSEKQHNYLGETTTSTYKDLTVVGLSLGFIRHLFDLFRCSCRTSWTNRPGGSPLLPQRSQPETE